MSGPAPALAPAQGNNKLFTVATFNAGAKNPESFLNKKGVPHAGFHSHFKSMCEELFAKADVVCMQEMSDFWVEQGALCAPDRWEHEVDNVTRCVTFWKPLLQRRATGFFKVFPDTTSKYKDWRRAMYVILESTVSGERIVVVNNHTIRGQGVRKIPGDASAFCGAAAQSLILQAMTLASAQGNYTWAVMGDFKYFMAPQFCTVVQNVPTPEHPDLGANAMLISGEHRDFVVSNGKQQEHVHRDLLKAWDKKHTAVFVHISSCVSAEQPRFPGSRRGGVGVR